MSKTNHIITAGLIFHSFSYAVYQAYLYAYDLETPGHVWQIWRLIFLIMVIMWIDNDSRTQKKIARCFDFQYMVFIFCPVYVPYYFIRTRGFVLGSAFLIGVIILYWLWYLVLWITYYFS